MNTQSKFMSAVLAALFAVSTLFSGSVLANHEDHGPVPLDDEVFNGYED